MARSTATGSPSGTRFRREHSWSISTKASDRDSQIQGGLNMSKPRIGIIVSTTRTGRFADKPLAWIHALASARSDWEVEVLDLRDYPMPFFDETVPPAWAPPKNEVARRWAAKIAELDGFIFLTAEYNHGLPAVLKNALDYAYKEFNRKPAACVGYGGVGAARAIEHLRLVGIELQIVPMRPSVHIGGPDFIGM